MSIEINQGAQAHIPEYVKDSKIGTLTFHKATNYGAILQAYALQQAILKLGVDTELIDYTCEAVEQRYRIKPTLKGVVGWITGLRTRRARDRRFRAFKDNHLIMSAPVDRSTIKTACERYRSVITGSDQVWNHEITGDDRSFLLDFLEPHKRMAYAVSLGVVDTFAPHEEDYANELMKFKKLTVRETRAADYLEGLLHKRPLVVCDPTFLLSKEEWDCVSVKPKTPNRYVLLYTFAHPTRDCMEWAKRQAEALQCEVLSLSLSKVPVLGVKSIRDAGPMEFLALIKDASFVVTNSFHGCCFSLIFNKDFCWYSHDSKSKRAQLHATRAKDLFNRLDIADRLVDETTQPLGSIDYNEVNTHLDSLRQASLRVLEEML